MTRDREHWDDADVAALFAPIDGAPARCPAPELLSASRAGTLPPDLQAHVSEHLVECTICRVLADALQDDEITILQPDESERILNRIRPATAPARPWRWPAAQHALLSAAVVLVAIAAWRIVRQETPEAPATHAPPIQVQAPATRVPVLDIASAPILPSDAQGPVAGDPRSVEERVDLLRALVPYREGDFARASTEFAAMTTRHPQSAAAQFYLGMSELMRGDQARAVGALETASRLEPFQTADGSEMLWYLAAAHYRAGATDRAVAPLQTLCNAGGSRADPACRALRSLVGRRTLRATVTDTSGTPLSGVLVGEHAISRPPSLVLFSFTTFSGRTDTAGRIEISGETATAFERLLVRAVKPGYFTSAVRLRAGLVMEHRFVLRPWVMTEVNQMIRATTTFDPSCEADIEACRRYAVTAPRNGRLVVSVKASAARRQMDLWLEVPGGDIYGPDEGSPLRLEIDAVAGTTYELRVLSYYEPRDFELSIQLK